MRYLILSDIHGNWEGLQAVLDHASGQYDQILCGGDLVGYGADPNPVIEWAREKVSVIVRGNHDKACAGLEDMEWFNPVARTAALWTNSILTKANLEYLRNLPRGPIPVEGFQILHGSPVDEDEYLINSSDVGQISPYLDCPLSFFGHTHVQGGFFWHRNGVKRIAKTPAYEDEHAIELMNGTVCLANPGSAGQPRDGDPRAAYLLYDPADPAIRYRRVRYDIPKAQEKIRKAGLPDILAERLTMGA